MADALFNGCAYVPDIRSMQAWLELAWKAGFDTAGGDMLGNVMQGSHQWIGTTECAALLRLYGLRAEIIDFTGAPQPSLLFLSHTVASVVRSGPYEHVTAMAQQGKDTLHSVASHVEHLAQL